MDLKDMQWEEFRNDSGEEIPAFAVMRCTGAALIDSGQVVLKMAKPNTYGSQYLHYLNGPIKVANGKFGLCTQSRGAVALYDTADGTPAFGERWGPRDATWKLKKNTGGFAVVEVSNSTDGLVMVQQAPMLSFHGVTDAAINKDAGGTVSIYYRSGATAYTDTTVNMSSVFNAYGNVGSGKDVRCQWENDATSSGAGWWEIVAAEC